MSSVSRIIFRLGNQLESSSTKKALAELRNSIGREGRGLDNIWPLLFENTEKELLGTGGQLTDAEKSILTTLQLYATHQQGNSQSVNLDTGKAEDDWVSLGRSLGVLRSNSDRRVAADRRFNALVTSSTHDEWANHVRHMIALLKQQNKTQRINYPKLAFDFYLISRGYGDRVKIEWSRDYYSSQPKQTNEEIKGDV